MKILHLFKQRDTFSQDTRTSSGCLPRHLKATHHTSVISRPAWAWKNPVPKSKEYHDKSYFALACASTGAGMIKQCIEKPPRFLLIDEIEDLRQSDQSSPLSLLQDGLLTETKVSKTC
jgi:hypothetical protein